MKSGSPLYTQIFPFQRVMCSSCGAPTKDWPVPFFDCNTPEGLRAWQQAVARVVAQQSSGNT